MSSSLLKKISPAITLELNSKVTEMRSQGLDVISLTLGEPDCPTPSFICESAYSAMLNGGTRYTNVSGILQLRQAICNKLSTENHCEYSCDEICVGAGAKQPLYNTLMAICENNEEVIVPTPCWLSYPELIKLAGAKPVFVKCEESCGYALPMDRIRDSITDKTRAIIVNTPNNPTGAVYSRAQLEELISLACEKDFYIISDEVYEKIIYDGAVHYSPASFSAEAKKHVITINGFSKTYAMTGWRIGYVAAPRDIIKNIAAFQSHTSSNASSVSQYAALAALSGSQDEVDVMCSNFLRNRDLVLQSLTEMPLLTYSQPQGAFYVLVNVSAYFGKHCSGKLISNCADFAFSLLEEKLVSVVPGSAFQAPDSVRLSFSSSTDLDIAMERIKSFLEMLE